MNDLGMFDRLVAQAWPAPAVAEFAGWRLRYAGGVTKRANSVWPAAEPSDAEAAIDEAERLYRERGLPPTFSISEGARPADLDDRLAARGYEIVDPTLVMTRSLDERPAAAVGEVAAHPSREWLELWWSVDGRGDADALKIAAEILTGVPAGYVQVGDGVGRGVLQGDRLGIYAMAVAPHARRRGLAGQVLSTLLAWGAERGASEAYLVVVERNAAARALYERAGFAVTPGGYHYRRAPERS